MSKGTSTIKNVFTVGAFTMLSRVLGLVREVLQAGLIGAGVAQSAFSLAFAVPNMARKLFGEGALTAQTKNDADEGCAEQAMRPGAVSTNTALGSGPTAMPTH